MLHNISL